MVKEKKICVFGDSLVSSEHYKEYDNWVAILLKYVSKLNKDNLVYNQGISGETTTGLIKRIDVELKARSPNIIIIHIGSNDANLIKGKMQTSEKEFVSNYKNILLISKIHSRNIIVTGLTPCDESKTRPTIWDKNEFILNKNIKEYNDIIKIICKKENVLFLDIFDDFKNQKNYAQSLVKEDGIHLNKKGNEFFANKLIEFGKSKKIW
jgi:lysophospholipase L1-like esterase